jgi:hypothetical protein
VIDKLEAARGQIECAIRLVAAADDELAVHTLVMATYGILEGLAKGNALYEKGIKPVVTKIGQRPFRAVSNFLKHADRDPQGTIPAIDPPDTDYRVGFCIILYREIKGTFTPAMAAFHHWMVICHPDEFNVAEDLDKDFERLYREGLTILDRETELIMLNSLLKVFQDGTIPANVGFARRPIISREPARGETS